MTRLLLLSLLCALLGLGCARTVYTNLHPREAPPVRVAADRSSSQAWRHFFIFGWAPGEMVIDAAHQCGGVAQVDRIETRQSFAQGLVTALAVFYINIYAPYTGRVVCEGADPRR